MTTVLISGASGLIGSALSDALRKAGDTVRRLVRREPTRPDEVAWDPDAGVLDPEVFDRIDAVVHLAGENIGRRWTTDRRRRIRDSRIDGTRLIASAIAALPADRRPRLMISASAVGFYGSRGDEVLDESSTAGAGFLADVCRDWEACTAPAQEAGVRVVCTRSGVVLSRRGGALARMMLPFRVGLGGHLGSGRQWMSWIALDDAVRGIQLLMASDTVTGPVNLVSPNPVTNAELTRALAHSVGLPAFLPVPAAVLRLVLGQMADETLLASQRARPRRLIELGMSFESPTIETALRRR
jgi:hypothetical protein